MDVGLHRAKRYRFEKARVVIGNHGSLPNNQAGSESVQLRRVFVTRSFYHTSRFIRDGSLIAKSISYGCVVFRFT